MRAHFAPAVALVLVVAAPRAAQATAVTVLGSSDARECFLNASTRSSSVASLDSCREALASSDLTRRDRAATHVNMGIILNALSRVDDAMQAFDAALALSPRLPAAVLSRGNSHFQRGDYDRAIADYELSLRYGLKDEAAAHFNRGLAHGKKRNFREAARSYRRALEVAPEFERARQWRELLRSTGVNEAQAPE